MGETIFSFFLCLICGVVGGVLYDIVYCIRYPFRAGWVRWVADAVFCMLFTALYLFFAVLFELGDLRAYHCLGCAAGLFLYLKSFHKIVAFFAGMIYNGIASIRKGKTSWKRSGRFRKKKQGELPSAQP